MVISFVTEDDVVKHEAIPDNLRFNREKISDLLLQTFFIKADIQEKSCISYC